MKISRWFAWLMLFLGSLGNALGATDVRIDFSLNTTDENGDPITERRYYFVYRPDNLSKANPVPLLFVLDGTGIAARFHAKADQYGFVVVSGSFSGNSLGKVWNNDDPRITGFEDYDYVTAIINRVIASENCNDAFITGLSKNGHMSLAYACERPDTIKGACSVDEFMGLTSNVPSAPVPIIVFQGTADSNVPYTMVKDTVDAWRTMNGLLNATPVTTYESSPRKPGQVTQSTWRGGTAGTQVAFVTIISGSHRYAWSAVETGYDATAGIWGFFSQFLTRLQDAPKIVSQPVDNIQFSGQPASFWVSAMGQLPLTYQWLKNGVAIAGATTNWYTTRITSPADNGTTLSVVVTNSSGSVTSTVATLTVNAPVGGPSITTPPADQMVLVGQPVNFSAIARGTGMLSYQWKKNGLNIAGATSSSLRLPAAILADCGAAFSVLVSDTTGYVISPRATLTVRPASGSPIILVNPVRARVLTNQTATFSVTASSLTPMRHQWQKGIFGGNMADITGATNSIYTTPDTTLADHHTLFRCVVANGARNATSASEMLFVTTKVNAPTDITSSLAAFGQVGVPFSYTILSSGGTASITYTANPLPDGLSLDASTGAISGAPTAPGITHIAISATNDAGNAPTRTLILTVTTTPVITPKKSWRPAAFGASAYNADIAGNFADPDQNGRNNITECSRRDPSSMPAIAIASDFEGGNIGKVEQVSDAHLRCAVQGESDQDKRNRQPSWFYFRLDGVAGRELTIDLTDLAGEYNYRPHKGAGLRNMRPVFSYDDQTWQHFAASEWDEQNSTIRVRLTPGKDRLWIARQPPYTTRHLNNLLVSLRNHPHFSESNVGKTVAGRRMLLLTVTNPKVADSQKKVLWLMARQHAWESGTSWVTEGALRFLLSNDPAAVRVRDRFLFKIFPMADPDGVVRGGVRFNTHGYDLNRNWDAVEPRLMPEIHAQRQAILDWLDSGHRLDLFLTLHNTEAADFIEGPKALEPLAQRFWKLLVDGTSFHSPNGPRLDAAGTTTPGMKGRMNVNQALFFDKQVPALLMEQMVDFSTKLSRCPTVQDRLEFGSGLVRALCAAVAGPAGR